LFIVLGHERALAQKTSETAVPSGSPTLIPLEGNSVDSASAYYNRGNSYYDLGEFAQAIADYTEVIRLNPAYVEAYYNRALAYYNLLQYEQSIADNTEAINIDPSYAAAYNNRV